MRGFSTLLFQYPLYMWVYLSFSGLLFPSLYDFWFWTTAFKTIDIKEDWLLPTSSGGYMDEGDKLWVLTWEKKRYLLTTGCKYKQAGFVNLLPWILLPSYWSTGWRNSNPGSRPTGYGIITAADWKITFLYNGKIKGFHYRKIILKYGHPIPT